MAFGPLGFAGQQLPIPKTNQSSSDVSVDELLQRILDTGNLPPPVQPEEIGRGQQFMQVLANALNAYASGVNPSVVPRDFVRESRMLRERRAQRATEDVRARQAARAGARRDVAQYRLGQIEREQDIEREDRLLAEEIERDRVAGIKEGEQADLDLKRQIALSVPGYDPGDLSAKSVADVIRETNTIRFNLMKAERGEASAIRFAEQEEGARADANFLVRTFIHGGQSNTGQKIDGVAERLNKNERISDIRQDLEDQLDAIPFLTKAERELALNKLRLFWRRHQASQRQGPTQEPTQVSGGEPTSLGETIGGFLNMLPRDPRTGLGLGDVLFGGKE